MEYLLREAQLPFDLLVPHELNEGFMRLNVRDKESISGVELYTVHNMQVVGKRKVSIQEVDALNQVWDLYSTDAQLTENVKKAFMEKWDTYKPLRLIRIWWESIPHSFTITPIGKALAHANAQRYNNGVPDIND